ncbi:DUF998 domain-containing protein [Clostridium sp. 'deep sea']|uniref:DUF998 domain-containing protein n=1 Tax=Clostridium sp. 'deep sea' TaxID=2779445 RepID=UPI001896419F|nr:DUF998 domain-containing protein [Clostridium sp. 'deep sea']QOR36309.1 DUF998 domain-containing protein [Clostridium sp. 'deep sea']
MNLWGSKLSWILLTIAIVGDFVAAYALALFYPSYSHSKQVMSVLGNPKSPVAFFYNLWLIILGILICFSAVNFYIVYSGVSKAYACAGAIILLMFGIGAGILAGLFSVNEVKEIETVASKIHGIGAGLGFMALTFIPLVVGAVFFKEGNSLFGIISVVFFLLSVVLFVLFIMSERETFQNSIIGLSGLWQRLLLASMYMPLLLLALKQALKYRT